MSETGTLTSRKTLGPAQANDEETQTLIHRPSQGLAIHTNENNETTKTSPAPSALTKTGLKVLGLLAFQNAFKNILMRTVMVGHPEFLLSTAVIVVEILKLALALGYIVLIEKRSLISFVTYMKLDWRNTILLGVPAPCYILQMSLEYVALTNLDPATYSVVVQMKMLTTAFFFRTVLGKKLMKKQILSLLLLTSGVILCNMSDLLKQQSVSPEGIDDHGTATEKTIALAARTKGILATCGESFNEFIVYNIHSSS